MFKRLKNWILNRPAEDHAVASFAWFGGAYLATGSALAFPVLAPVAVGAAVLASKIGFLEGIITGAHVINDVFSWGFNKIFRRKAKQPTPVKVNPPVSEGKPEKSHDKEHQPQNVQENPKIMTKENPQPAQEPIASIPGKSTPATDIPVQTAGKDQPTAGMPVQKNQPTTDKVQNPQQLSLMQLMLMAQQIKALSAEIKRLQQENLVLGAQIKRIQQENSVLLTQNLYLKKQTKQTGGKLPTTRVSNPRRRLVIHRHYIYNGRPVHE